MKILVTGNQGYIGTVLTEILSEKGYKVVGLDNGYYEPLVPIKTNIKQITKDIRKISQEDVKGFEAIIHLAGLSNDPLGEFDPDLTEQINFKSTVKLAKFAKKAGVKRFVFASTQSIYGISNSEEELREDDDNKNPITAYAITKWNAEQKIKKLNDKNFTVVCFRPATVFGVSPRLRCDIVFNNFVACSYTTGKIEVKSDGTPWRPIVHIRDVCAAFIAGIEAPAKIVGGESFNVGVKNGNYTVRDLAQTAQRSVPGSELVFTGEHGKDSRTYKVSFDKIFSVLKDYYHPKWNLYKGGQELVSFFKEIKFSEKDFRGRKTNRLAQLKYLIEEKRLDKNLIWAK